MNKILITITTFLLTFTNLYGSQDALDYSNPMPNLVRHVISNAEELHLTKDQRTAIDAWTKVNKPKVNQLVRQLSLEENKLLKESIGNDENVVQKAEATLNLRREIIEIKTLCRVHLKDILTPAQYAKVLSIYKETQYQDSQLIL